MSPAAQVAPPRARRDLPHAPSPDAGGAGIRSTGILPVLDRQDACPTGQSEAEPERFVYGRPFWLAYLANALLLSSVALLFRYADFVNHLGGTEFHLGWIVGVGMIGSLFTRLLLGSWIDRYGSRPLWIGSLALLSITCITHLYINTHAGPAIYLLRIAYCCALAGVNGASMTFVSGRGPTQRMAELVGMLGTAGFLGTVVGTLLGDLMLGSVAVGRTQVVEMFLVASILGLLAMPLAWAATASEKHTVKHHHGSESSLLAIVRRHNPGVVLAVGVAMGIGLGLPATFLRPYAADLGIPRIGLFFLVYAVAAIITRVLTRRWAELYGPRRIILVGLGGVVLSMVSFLLVRTEWQLLWPAIGYGCSHAVLFPSVVAAGSMAFPVENRGLATLLMLATWDFGQLIGAPTAGVALRVARLTGLPPYPTMFLFIAAILGIILIYYALRSRAAEKAVDFSVVSGSNKIELGGPVKLGQGALAPAAAGGQD